jgi:Stress responsive A/B Barrel Domain
MIKHIVLFKLKEFENEDQKAVVRNKIKQALLALKEKIEVLKYIEVGQNYELITSSHDICLITHFETFDDLDIYRIHPEHLNVVELIKTNTISRAVIDFEF